MKAVRCVSTPVADQDIEGLAVFYAEESGEELAIRFLLAVDQAIEAVRRNPEAGQPRVFGNPRLKGLRSWPIPGFEDIRLYYIRVDDDTLRMIRVLHGKRDLAPLMDQPLPPQ